MGQVGAAANQLTPDAISASRPISQIQSPMANISNSSIAQGPSKLKQFGKIAGAGLQGAAQNMPQQQQQGGYSPISIAESPQVDPSYFAPTNFGNPKGPKPSSFFGGY